MMLGVYLQGFGVSSGLIVAIGAQNAHVLAQGVRRNYPLLIALLCALSDAVLIVLGIGGVGALVAKQPLLNWVATWGGAAFLAFYGLLAFRSAVRGGVLEADGPELSSLKRVVLSTLAVTYLNPHCYLDTLVLIGGLSGQFQGVERVLFGAGAVSASFVWFFSLSLGAGMLAPIFRKPVAWRVLDTLVGGVMWTIAVLLIRGVTR